MSDNVDYRDSSISLTTEVEKPSYQQCLMWLKERPDDSPVTFDYWARGNFTRRLIYNRSQGINSLLIRVKNVHQMRWAYRRLALLGLAVDFIYTGKITKPQKLIHAMALRDEDVFDSGWGYIGMPTNHLVEDRKLLWLIGTARLMPSSILQWLSEEAGNRFLRGEVFVAPAELIGISRISGDYGIDVMSDLLNGAGLTEIERVSEALFNIELPFIEGMSPGDFEKLLEDEKDSLIDFRSAFYEITKSYRSSEAETLAALDRLKNEISAINRSARTARLRNLVQRCKGRFSIFDVGIGALATAGAAFNTDPFAGIAVVMGAAKILSDLWKESSKIIPDLRSKPLRLLWKLGAKVERSHPRHIKSVLPKTKIEKAKEIDPYHWLCPPTPGIELAYAMKDNL